MSWSPHDGAATGLRVARPRIPPFRRARAIRLSLTAVIITCTALVGACGGNDEPAVAVPNPPPVSQAAAEPAGATNSAGKANVSITDPAADAKVPQKQLVSGTAEAIPEDAELWVFTRKGTKTHPQSSVIKVKDDGTWAQTAYVGTADGTDPGTKFDILVYQVPKSGSGSISSYLKTAEQTKKYPGLAPPAGSEVLAQVSVVKK